MSNGYTTDNGRNPADRIRKEEVFRTVTERAAVPDPVPVITK